MYNKSGNRVFAAILSAIGIMAVQFQPVVAVAGNAPDIMQTGFTALVKVNLDGAASDEPLCEAGPLRLSLRMAGEGKPLKEYDRDSGNYLNFPLPNGRCPVLEATMGGLRVGIPVGLLERREGSHDVIVNLANTHFSILVDGHMDDDMFKVPSLDADLSERKSLSQRVKSFEISAPAIPDALGRVPDSRRIEGSIQYWTPPDHNAWVGDVAPGVFNGKLHVFYLFDRRHHRSKFGVGGHYFAHLSSGDLVQWDEHPHAVPLDEWWTSEGTGTPFVKDGKLCLAYGLHTSRITKDSRFPIGGTYAESKDGIHFTKTMRMITDAQNPSIYNLPGGGYELVTSYGGTKGIFRSVDLVNWKLYDDVLPFRGDCPSLFDWHGHRYLLQGFSRMAYSANGEPGSFVDWTKDPDVAYDGLSVPMVVPWRGDRRLYIGWLAHPAGWGGWLVFRELVSYPDGHLGLKWVPEIKPPVPAMAFHVGAGGSFACKFVPDRGGTALVLAVDPERREASFVDDVANAKLGLPSTAGNFKIGGLRCVDGSYCVKVAVWYDSKADVTIFDAEIGSERTLICRRYGRFKVSVIPSMKQEE